jgi:hypothetical protein
VPEPEPEPPRPGVKARANLDTEENIYAAMTTARSIIERCFLLSTGWGINVSLVEVWYDNDLSSCCRRSDGGGSDGGSGKRRERLL